MFEIIKSAAAQLTVPDTIGSGTAPGLDPVQFEAKYNITNVITNIINFVLFLAGAVAVFFLVYGGIQYITANGDPDKASKGKTTVINSVIGIIIILAALLIVNWVKGFVTGGGTTS